MPAVPVIADNIATIGALAEAARAAGSTLRVQTESEYDALESALDALRTAASALPDRVHSLRADRERLLAEQTTHGRSVKAYHDEASAAFEAWRLSIPASESLWQVLKARFSPTKG